MIEHATNPLSPMRAPNHTASQESIRTFRLISTSKNSHQIRKHHKTTFTQTKSLTRNYDTVMLGDCCLCCKINKEFFKPKRPVVSSSGTSPTLFNKRIRCLCLQLSRKCFSRWRHLVPCGSLASNTCPEFHSIRTRKKIKTGSQFIKRSQQITLHMILILHGAGFWWQ